MPVRPARLTSECRTITEDAVDPPTASDPSDG